MYKEETGCYPYKNSLDAHAKSERKGQTLAKKTFAYPTRIKSELELLSGNSGKGLVFCFRGDLDQPGPYAFTLSNSLSPSLDLPRVKDFPLKVQTGSLKGTTCDRYRWLNTPFVNSSHMY